MIGLWWNRKLWPVLALIFFGIFAFFFTTVFTNAGGLFDGLVRFLGYWIQQHAEQRGGQPWFYYLFLQIPIYEYLPAVGAVIALVIAVRRKLWASASDRPFEPSPASDETANPRPHGSPVPVLGAVQPGDFFLRRRKDAPANDAHLRADDPGRGLGDRIFLMETRDARVVGRADACAASRLPSSRSWRS